VRFGGSRLVIAGVDFGDQVSLVDVLVVLDVHPKHLAGNPRADSITLPSMKALSVDS